MAAGAEATEGLSTGANHGQRSRRAVLALLIAAAIVTTLGILVIAGLALTSHARGSGSPRLWTTVSVLPIAGLDQRWHASPRTLSLPD